MHKIKIKVLQKVYKQVFKQLYTINMPKLVEEELILTRDHKEIKACSHDLRYNMK
jgi:hypothetical protein